MRSTFSRTFFPAALLLLTALLNWPKKAKKPLVVTARVWRLFATQAVLCVVLFAVGKSGLCDVLAVILPQAFVRPTITVAEFFRKSGEAKQ